MIWTLVVSLFFAFTMVTIGGAPSEAAEKVPGPGVYAVFDTSMGKITCRLFEKEAPKTVANFIGLAEGTKKWIDPVTGQPQNGKKLYDGLIFHRVIPNFMIQGGDPRKDGTGGPGYQFEDEIAPKLRFDKPGRLAMANAGPNTNGSQFFITDAPTPWLDGRHTIFGELVSGMDVVQKIARAPRSQDGRDRPLQDAVIKTVTIVRK